MCFCIGIEDLAANALIEILQSKNGDDSQNIVTYAELEKYGAEVVHYLGEQGEKAVLILSRENTNHMLCSYSDFFVETEIWELLDKVRSIAAESGKATWIRK